MTIVLLEPGWKQCIHTMYKQGQVVIRKCLPVLAQKLALFGFYVYLVYARYCTQFQGTFVFFSFTNIATNYLVFAICILKNSCKCCALIITFFYEGQAVSMETKYLWLMFGVHNNTFTRPKDIVVFNRNVFKTPYMQHLLNMKKG